MITLTELKTANFSIEHLTITQLINLSIDSHNDKIGLDSKLELIRRGTDNIATRIQIKKEFKTKISNLQEEINSKEQTESKSKFLATVSILDKLQLEWQKKDLVLKIH